MRKDSLLVVLAILMLILLRGTRTPNGLALTVLLWVLAFFVVAFTLATFRFPSMRWTHLGAATSTLVLFLIPPVPDSWLAWVPDVIPAGVTLAYLSLLSLRFWGKDDVLQKGSRRRAVTFDEVALGLVLLWISSAPGLLARLLKGQLESAIEWDGAWAPLLGAIPVLIGLVAYSLVWRGLQRSPTTSEAGGEGEVQDA